LRAHAPQKQVVDPAHVTLVIVSRDALAQIAVQCQHVEYCLQVIATLQHGAAQSRRRIVLQRRAEIITLVVGYVEASIVFKHQVDDAGDHAAEISPGWKIQAAGRGRSGGAVRTATEGTACGTIERCHVHLVDGEIKGQLVQPLLRRNHPETQTVFAVVLDQGSLQNRLYPPDNGFLLFCGIKAKASGMLAVKYLHLRLDITGEIQILENSMKEQASAAAGNKIHYRVRCPGFAATMWAL